MCQYPFAFEYNQFFIKYMAYHSSSAFFTTFLLDSAIAQLIFAFVKSDRIYLTSATTSPY